MRNRQNELNAKIYNVPCTVYKNEIQQNILSQWSNLSSQGLADRAKQPDSTERSNIVAGSGLSDVTLDVGDPAKEMDALNVAKSDMFTCWDMLKNWICQILDGQKHSQVQINYKLERSTV